VIDYLEIASRAMERFQALSEPESGPATQQKPERAAASPHSEPDEVLIPWAEWKARELNRLFLEKGVTREPGRITTETVRNGERMASNGADEAGGRGTHGFQRSNLK